MKRSYSKPTIHVEVMAVDMPIAASCNTTGGSSGSYLQGWFIANQNCSDYNHVEDPRHDTDCTHVNIITGFSS